MAEFNLSRALGHMEGQLEGIQNSVDDLRKSVVDDAASAAARVALIEARVSKLEQSKAYLLGAAAVLSLVLSMAYATVTKFMSGGAP